jgi:hypothetical protein
MKAGTIVFHGADLALYGTPRFTLRKTPDPAPPAAATHQRIEISVTVELRAEMPATVWARARALQALLASTTEGRLEVRDENGGSTGWLVRPAGNSLPDAIRRGHGRVEMAFSGMETLADTGVGMTIDPLDGSPPLQIDRVTAWSMNVGISRPDERAAHRELISSGVTFSARTAFADPTADAATRAATLMVEAERLRALSGAQVHMTFAGFSRVVQVESFRATPSTGWEYIDLEAQVRFNSLPGDTEAEVSFTSEPVTDPATGETRITVSGNVRAPDKATAHAKIDAILESWRTPKRRVARISRKDAWVDGQDSEMPLWLSVEFSIELTEGSEQARYTLKIDDREGPDGHRITYSGTAYAATIAVLLATVEQASAGKHPITVRQDLSMDLATDDQGEEKLMSASFSHEYATAATRILGNATLTENRSNFGEHTLALSGSISAPTMEQARAVARSLIPGNVILRTDEEVETAAINGTASGGDATLDAQSTTLAFSYAWGTNHAITAIQYEDSSSPDYTRMTETREFSGVCHAPNKAAAVSQVNLLLSGIMGQAKPLRRNFSNSHEREISSTTKDRWLSFRFSYAYEVPISDTLGHDIIEAQFSLHRIGMVDHIPMTEIPLQKPVTQLIAGTMENPTGFGYNIGRMVASGMVRARVQSTARAWGQAKRTAIKSLQGAEDPPDERMGVTYIPFDGVNAAFYEFTFQYGFRFASGLEGVWPSSGLTV